MTRIKHWEKQNGVEQLITQIEDAWRQDRIPTPYSAVVTQVTWSVSLVSPHNSWMANRAKAAKFGHTARRRFFGSIVEIARSKSIKISLEYRVYLHGSVSHTCAFLVAFYTMRCRYRQKTHWNASLPRKTRKRKASTYLRSVPRRNRETVNCEPCNCLCVCVHLLLFVPTADATGSRRCRFLYLF